MPFSPEDELRRLRQISAKKPIIKRGLPDTSEGRDGDVSLCLNQSGLGLYFKFNNRWYKFGEGRQVATGGSAAVDLSNRTSTRIPNLVVDKLHVKDLAEITGTLRGGTSGAVTKVLHLDEDASIYAGGKDGLKFDLSNNALYLGRHVNNLLMNTDQDNTASYFNIASKDYDSAVRFQHGGAYKWIIGNDQSDSHKFCIHPGSATIPDSKNFEIDTSGNVNISGLTTSGSITSTGTLSFGSLKDTGENITVTKFVDETDGIGSNDNDTTIPTSAAVKDYVDTNVTAQDLDISDGSATIAIDLDSETLTLSGNNPLTASASGNGVTFSIADGSTSQKGAVQLIDEDNMSTDSTTRVPTQQSVKAYVDTEVANLVDSAPAALDTLNELAAALNDDASFSTTVTNSLATKLNLSGGDMTGHLQITASDGSHSGGGSYVPGGSDWQNVLRLGATSDNGLNILVNDAGTMKASYYTNRWGCQHEWARGSEDTGDGNTYQPAMRLTSSDSTNILYLYDGTTNGVNIRLSAESSNDTYFNNSDSDVAIGSTSAGGYKLKVTGTTHITGALTVDSTVDGRDLQTDGSKLDGIEASATADQTAVEIIGLLNSDLGGNFTIGNQSDDSATFSGDVIIGGDLTASGGDIVFDALTTAKALTIKGAEGQGASIELWADEGDDTDADGGDKWQIEATTGNDLEFYEKESDSGGTWRSRFMLAHTGNVVVRDELLIATVNAGDGSSEDLMVIDSGDNKVKKRTYAQIRSDLGIADNEIIDWTTDQGSTNIHSGNYTDTNTNQLTTFTVSATTDSNATTISQGDDLFFAAGTGITCETTADGTVTITNTVSNTDTQLSDEQVQDKVGAMFSSNTETLISATYQDGDGTIDLVVDNDLSNYDNSSSGFITATLTTEQVQDIVGAMFTSNTETRISATYEDGDGTIDLVVDDMTADTNTTYSAGDLLDLSTTTFNVDLTELTDGTADVVGSADELVYLDDGVQKRKQIDEIKLGQFNNDQNWTDNTGDITRVKLICSLQADPSYSNVLLASSGDADFNLTSGTGVNVAGNANTGTATFSVASSQTGIGSILNTSLVVGRDADNQIKFDTDNTMVFRTEGTDNITFTEGKISVTAPNAHNAFLELKADNSDDNGDDWKIEAKQGAIEFSNDISGSDVVQWSITTNATTADGVFYVPMTITADGGVTGNVTGNLTGTASLVTVTDNSDAANKPVVFHNGSNALQDDSTNFSFNPSTGIMLVPKVKLGSNIIENSAGETTITTDTDQGVKVEGQLILGGGIICAADGGASITVDNSDNVEVAGDLTVSGTNGILAGAVVWQEFHFVISGGTNGRYYFRDVDDLYGSAHRWDAYDTTPTSFSYLAVPGQFTVPENCTLVAMSVTLRNYTSSSNPTVSIYHGTPNTNTSSNTTLALAGSATEVSITTARYVYNDSATYDVDLTAGDIVVPMVSHTNSLATQTLAGGITLKFITR